MNINGNEILYFNEDTFFDLSKNVRGGIPLLFPQAGPLREGSPYPMKQHGFARNSSFLSEITSEKIVLYFSTNKETFEVFPFSFHYRLEIVPLSNGFRLINTITNTGDTVMPIAPWLHPYFAVANEFKQNISLSTQKENFFDTWSIGGTHILENTTHLDVKLWKPYLLELDYDQKYKYIWLWSEPGKDFICIEPVTRNENGLLDAPILLSPHAPETFVSQYTIKDLG